MTNVLKIKVLFLDLELLKDNPARRLYSLLIITTAILIQYLYFCWTLRSQNYTFMSYPSETNFDISLVKRTIDNFYKFYKENGSTNEYEFTFLLNSLIGLLFIPNEYSKQKPRELSYDFLQKKADTFKPVKDIFRGRSTICDRNGKEYKQAKFMYKSKKGNDRKLEEITLGELLNRMRNGIAHFHITPTQDKTSKKWKGIILRNYTENDFKNFEVYLTQEEVKEFALFIANKYCQT